MIVDFAPDSPLVTAVQRELAGLLPHSSAADLKELLAAQKWQAINNAVACSIDLGNGGVVGRALLICTTNGPRIFSWGLPCTIFFYRHHVDVRLAMEMIRITVTPDGQVEINTTKTNLADIPWRFM